MYNASYWYGKECEGRLSDIETVFVRKDVPSNFQEYPHIYFTIEYIEARVKDKEWGTILGILDTRQYVTVEANASTLEKIPMNIFNRAHIIYRISDPNFQRLKETDTLSIDQDWYRVHQITKCNMMQMTPDSYKYDRRKD